VPLPPPTAIISYAHDGEAFNSRVIDLAGQLRSGGVDVELDAYNPHPTQGWAKWMERQLSSMDYIIIALTPRWITSFDQSDDRATGARYEGAIISSMLLRNGVSYERIAVTYFDPALVERIPPILHSCARYDLSSSAVVNQLYEFLTAQAKIEKPPHLATSLKLLATTRIRRNGFGLLVTFADFYSRLYERTDGCFTRSAQILKKRKVTKVKEPSGLI
jgi:hypothetical protein